MIFIKPITKKFVSRFQFTTRTFLLMAIAWVFSDKTENMLENNRPKIDFWGTSFEILVQLLNDWFMKWND